MSYTFLLVACMYALSHCEKNHSYYMALTLTLYREKEPHSTDK